MADDKNEEKGIPSPFMSSPSGQAHPLQSPEVSKDQMRRIKEILGTNKVFVVMIKEGASTCGNPDCKHENTPVIMMEGFQMPDLVMILEKTLQEFKKLISMLMGGTPPSQP